MGALQEELMGLGLAIDALQRTTKRLLADEGDEVFRPRKFGKGSYLDLAREIQREISERLDDVEKAAYELPREEE